jgi:hypothetical protein
MGFYSDSTATPATSQGAGHFYSAGAQPGIPDISLRDEFDKLIDGYGGWRGLGQILIFRKMDRDGTKCACWDSVQGSSSDCKYCEGETYTWEEEFHRAHFTQTFGRSLAAAGNLHILKPQGYFDTDKALVYSKSDSSPQTGDAIYRISTTEDGAAYYPIERIEKWRIVGAEDRREEGSKIAFWICLCERVEV